MKCIVGLGNPGNQYIHTRHNAGFCVLDLVAEELDAIFSDKPKVHAHVAELNLDGEKLILAKPTTFMNRSGQAVQALMQAFSVTNEDVWIVHDDVSLPIGSMRIRASGSAGGHNGIQSIIDILGTDQFWRFKVGVGMPENPIALEDWVLSKFGHNETELVQNTFELTKEQLLNAFQTEPSEESETLI